MIIRVRVVLRRIVWGDFDRRFDNLSGSHLQSQAKSGTSGVDREWGFWDIDLGKIPKIMSLNFM